MLHVNCLREDAPGEKWQSQFEKTWPYYRKWFLTKGLLSRKTYRESAGMLERYMPELLSTYHSLCRLAGGGDTEARFLSLYSPPPYMAGCSQLAWRRDKYFLIRNYDFSPALFEGVMFYTKWLKPVIGISDCNWGLLDGINSDGLAASLAFGGRNQSGEGFGIPIIIRYILETCANTNEAVKKLQSIPSHMSYNVTVMDAAGSYATVYLAPDKPPMVLDEPIATNQQERIDWPEYASVTKTQERKKFLENCLSRPGEDERSISEKFLQPPLYNHDYDKTFGTLYTAKYYLAQKSVDLLWPSKVSHQSMENFREIKLTVELTGNALMAAGHKISI